MAGVSDRCMMGIDAEVWTFFGVWLGEGHLVNVCSFFPPKISFSSPASGNPSRYSLASRLLHFSLARWDKLTQSSSHFSSTWPLGERKKSFVRGEHPSKKKKLPPLFWVSELLQSLSGKLLIKVQSIAASGSWGQTLISRRFIQIPKPPQDYLNIFRIFDLIFVYNL